MTQLLTLPEVADLLKVSVPTLRTWHRQKKINTVKLPSGAIRIRQDEVERILAGA